MRVNLATKISIILDKLFLQSHYGLFISLYLLAKPGTSWRACNQIFSQTHSLLVCFLENDQMVANMFYLVYYIACVSNTNLWNMLVMHSFAFVYSCMLESSIYSCTIQNERKPTIRNQMKRNQAWRILFNVNLYIKLSIMPNWLFWITAIFKEGTRSF